MSKGKLINSPVNHGTDNAIKDLDRFQELVMTPYLEGRGDNDVCADDLAARSFLPPSTARQRDFSAVAFDFPKFKSQSCVACMECVVACPDAAIYARVTTEDEKAKALIFNGEDRSAKLKSSELDMNFVKAPKFWNTFEKRGKTPGHFSLWIDPEKCKGCGECVAVCNEHKALDMIPKEELKMEQELARFDFFKTLPPTSDQFINDKLLVDLFLLDDHWVYKGGAGSCKGCGEISALKMALAATSYKYGKNMAVIAATGCNSVFSATYPYNIFSVPWTNPLFENAPATGIGVRMRLDQNGKQDTKVWIVGGDGAMSDIGFQSLSRALVSGDDINVLVLDTQVYSNTGGQASSSTFMGQNAKMSATGKVATGKTERRKELGLIMMNHPDVYVAQVSPAFYNHYLRAVMGALEYKGPSIVIAYAPCMPEHGIADDSAFERSHAAVQSRAFPIFVHDPRAGKTLKQRLDLRGNPSLNQTWHTDHKTGETQDFLWFARGESRFAQGFNSDKSPTDSLLASQDDRARNWDYLRELAGML